MNSREDYLLTTAYCPPIDYFKALSRGNRIFIEAHESFRKQSYRNRCNILASDGILSLTVPVLKNSDRHIRTIEIDYSRPWLQQHKRALISAYMSSPFFEYYKDDIFEILDSKVPLLFDLNRLLIDKLIEFVEIENNIRYTDSYRFLYEDDILDLREKIDPKKKCTVFGSSSSDIYYQVFSNKLGFVGNLSILDLLFNEGPDTISFL